MKIIVIGAGGVGSWLVPQLTRLKHRPIIWDGDTLEDKNLDRQLFDSDQIGMNKAEAMAQIYEVEAVPRWFHADADGLDVSKGDWLFCCADNHRARRECLAVCDDSGATSIIMGNGYTDADAYLYKQEWEGTPADPRVRYPSILTDQADDPITAQGCTGHAQIASPQLVLANVRAADHGLHLFWFHHTELKKMKSMDQLLLPVENGSSKFEYWTKTYQQLVEEHRLLEAA